MRYIEVGCSLLPSTKYISIWYSVSGKYLGIQLNRSLQSVTLDLENSSLSMFVYDTIYNENRRYNKCQNGIN